MSRRTQAIRLQPHPHHYLATDLIVGAHPWSRFAASWATDSSRFSRGQGLWIDPSTASTTSPCASIDAVYLDRDRIVIHIEEGLKPWRLAAVRARAASVLELPTVPSTNPNRNRRPGRYHFSKSAPLTPKPLKHRVYNRMTK